MSARARSLARAAALALLATSSLAHAQPAPADAVDVSGLERPAESSWDAAREVANVLVFVPRETIDLVFQGMTAAAELVENEHLVPRVREIFSTTGGEVFAFPTLFAETSHGASVGARMIAFADYAATTFRVGFGGIHDLVAEARVLVRARREHVPVQLALEGLVEKRSGLEYLGVGQTPTRDARNVYRPERVSDVALYGETRVRAIAGAGLRLDDLTELFLSTSLGRRTIVDEPGLEGSRDEGRELSRVFVDPPFLSRDTWTSYSEAALRLDTRRTRGRPSPGLSLEGYLGGVTELRGEDVALVRGGGRLAGFIPIYRASNILSPRLVLDLERSFSAEPVPFTELAQQTDFRGFDTHRDLVSAVGSLDFAWQLVDFLGARLFLDAAIVAPSVGDLDFTHLRQIRFVAGAGFDLYSSTTSLGQLSLSVGPEGARALLSFGVPRGHGDRQHWE